MESFKLVKGFYYMNAVFFLSSMSRYVINFSRSAYNLLGIKEVSSTIESEGRSCLIPTNLKFPVLTVLHKDPLVHRFTAPSSVPRTYLNKFFELM